MCAKSTQPPSTLNTLAWDELAGRVDSLVEAWEEGHGEPQLEDFVEQSDVSIRPLILIELIKVDLEYRWKKQQPKSLEDYLAEFPEVADGGTVPSSLIWEEYHVRRHCGEDPQPVEYFDRFPAQAQRLQRLFNLELAPQETVSLSTKLAAIARLSDARGQLDDFELVRRVGEGSFATVYLAKQKSMRRFVALKVSANVNEEPQTLAQLDHPNIVRVHDQRILENGKLRLLYMQYLPGGTLQDVIQHSRKLPASQRNGQLLVKLVEDSIQKNRLKVRGSITRDELGACVWTDLVCRLGSQLAAGLAYAHAQGVLHRDVKPANILLTAEGVPQLADFNISYCAELEGASAGDFFGGSLAYMSPEQLEAYNPSHDRVPADLDAHSDVYSLGVVLWELLTGKRPHRDRMAGQGIQDQLAQMASTRHAGVPEAAHRELPAETPDVLKETLLKCLAPNVTDRFASAGDLSTRLTLCTDPTVQRLLSHHPPLWLRVLRRFPLLVVLLTILLPNVLLSQLNIVYNFQAVVQGLSDREFDTQVVTINSVAYSVGLAAFAILAWPLARTVKHLQMGKLKDPMPAPWLRRRCLRLGEIGAWICIAEWVLCGFVFPIWTHATSEGVTPRDYLHFILSQVICGVIAGALVFFWMTFIAVRGLYPRLIPSDEADDFAVRQASRLAQRTWLYLILHVAACFVSVTVLALIDSEIKVAFLSLGVLGVLGFAAALPLTLAIRTDLTALAKLLKE